VTEMLATLLMMPPDAERTWEETASARMEAQLEGWLDRLCREDPVATRRWLEMLGAAGDEGRPGLVAALGERLGCAPAPGAGGEGRPGDLRGLLPVRLLGAFREPTYHRAARGAIENLVNAYYESMGESPGLPPIESRLLAADGRTVLNAAERALSEDVHELFLAPLLTRLHEVAGAGAPQGRGVASNTSITVVSDELGVVHSSSVSYFDVSRPRWELTLDPAAGGGEEGRGSFPREADEGASPAGAARQLSALAEGWGVRALHNADVWEVLTDGSVLGFVPHVLPGGSAADIEIELLIGRDNPRQYPANARPATVPLSSVARHRTHTSVYVDSLDLFALSSLSLTTTHPRPDFETPILADLPIIGEMFRFKRGAQSVHHESIMLVYATILPTGADLTELIDAEPLQF